LIMRRRVPPGKLLAIHLKRETEGKSLLLTGEVRYVRLQPDGTWMVGCSLVPHLSPQEVFSLL
jgi:hypothetical protein